MVNVFFELDRLRTILQEKGVDVREINNIVAKARQEIDDIFNQYGEQAIDQMVEIGVQKRSPEFINELRLNTINFEIQTDSGRLDFSEPPRPMLPFLLKNAKPMKDGTGFYKVIPVRKPGSRAKVSSSISDLQKKIIAERVEHSIAQQKAIAPTNSVSFRTASSKQDITKQWVQPAQDRDFSDDVKRVNEDLTHFMDDSIRDIINKYVEMF